MKKEGFYATLINTLVGMGIFPLLKGNLLALVLITIFIITLIILERKWIYRVIFRRKRNFAIAGYFGLVAVFLITLFVLTTPTRETSVIVKQVNGFLHKVTKGHYQDAYKHLSDESKKAYPLREFSRDHTKNRVKIQNFVIQDVTFNKYDKSEAAVVVAAPLKLYDRDAISLDMVKENGEWRVVFSRSIVTCDAAATAVPVKKEGAFVQFFKGLF